jgi:hypothetical protein
MERERRRGQMGPNMKGNGVMAWPKVRVHFIMRMEIFIMVIS